MFWNHTRKNISVIQTRKAWRLCTHFSQTGYPSLLLILQNKFYCTWLPGGMSKTTNTMEVHYHIKTEILNTSTPQGCPACMSHKVHTAHKASQASWTMLWTDIPSGVHHRIKFVSLVMQKGQWSCQKDVSWRRLLLPQWLTQPLLPAFTRPQERQLSGFLLLLHRNMFLKQSPADPLQDRGS